MLSACTQSSLTFTHDPGTLATGTLTWHTPAVTDFEAMVGTSVGGGPGLYFPNYTSSFTDFRAANSSTTGQLTAGIWDGSNFRLTSRIYEPVSLGGAGWTSAGAQFAFLDSGAGVNYFGVELGYSPSGISMSFGTDGAVAANTIQAIYRSESFGNKTPSIGAQLLTVPAATPPTSGYLSANAWDSAGHAYYAYRDTNTAGKVQRYTSFVGWDTGPGTHLGAGVQQLALLQDSNGVAPIWLGDGLVHQGVFSGAGDHSCAIASDGVLRCWGANASGQLGCLGQTVCGASSAVPLPVSSIGGGGYLSGVVSVAIGGSHTCAVLADSSVRCWGSNSKGQLGNNSTTDSSAPVAVVGIAGTGFLTGVTSLSAGANHTCAARSDGSAVCWGDNAAGELGCHLETVTTLVGSPTVVCTAANTPPSSSLPVTVSAINGGPSTLTKVTSLSANGTFTCALFTSGQAACWGDNTKSQLGCLGQAGCPAAGNLDYPINVSLAGSTMTGASSISAGALHACVTRGGNVYCWGNNANGELGKGAAAGGVATQATTAVTDGSASISGVLSVAAGTGHSCALQSSGGVQCWGDNTQSELGNPAAASPSTVAVKVLQQGAVAGGSALTGVTQISAGDLFACALTRSSQLLCWGDNTSNKLGNSLASPQGTPSDVVSTSASYISAATVVTLRAGSLVGDAVLQNAQVISTFPIPNTSTSPIPGFSAASDGSGNLVVVYYQANPGVALSSCAYGTMFISNKNCNVRLYASVRNTSGAWAGPTQLDSQLTPQTTTFYQDSSGIFTTGLASPANVAGGVNYAVPTVAYVGSGRFIVAYTAIDTLVATSTLYWTGYTVGTGWDTSTQVLDLQSIPSTTAAMIEPFRYMNDLYLVGDPTGGNALLIAHGVDPNSVGFTDNTLRSYNFKLFHYSSGTFDSGTWLDSTYKCQGTPASPYPCWNPKPQGAVFSTGEAFAILPITDPTSSSLIRLYSTEYRP